MTENIRMKIASKRQVTIPQRLLNLLHMREGDHLEVVAVAQDQVTLRSLKLVPTSLFTPEILKKLDEREAEMNAGKYVEVQDASELFKKRRTKTRAVSAHST